MDLLILDDVATSVVKWRMYPYFDIAHYILMSTAVRDDTPQSGSANFSRKHPFACWFATMLMCFGGSILSNFVMGEPLFTCFDDHRAILTATAIWYLINYSPFDIVYKFCRVFSIRLIICALKEVQRAKKISVGVAHAYEHYPSSIFTCLLSGILKGAGYLEMRILARLARGVWLPASTEFLHPSFTTEISLLAAVVYYCEHLGMIPLPSNQIFLAVVSVLVYLRVAMLVLGVKDPFAPIQNLTCTIFFGGIVDALKTAVSPVASDVSVGSGPPASPSAISTAAGQTNAPNPAMVAGGPTTTSSSPVGVSGAIKMANSAAGEPSGNQSGSNSPFPGSKNGTMRRGATPLQDKKAV
ncbi:unnamed protein product [Schistocephalus solidus]|uniref:Trimeric intracellular cation channel type B n=2 Tax=Schistocephalus solidus TaxID=70667 RepID=A0A183SEL2_SCHSO|nr:unnamed protein product [Schistocephalus solidus]